MEMVERTSGTVAGTLRPVTGVSRTWGGGRSPVMNSMQQIWKTSWSKSPMSLSPPKTLFKTILTSSSHNFSQTFPLPPPINSTSLSSHNSTSKSPSSTLTNSNSPNPKNASPHQNTCRPHLVLSAKWNAKTLKSKAMLTLNSSLMKSFLIKMKGKTGGWLRRESLISWILPGPMTS